MALQPTPSDAPASSASDKDVSNIFYGLLKRILCSSLGESAGRAVLLLITKNLQQDLSRALWENPKNVYDELFKIFGEGTKVLMNIIVSSINQECKLNIKPERFMELMRSENRDAVEELRSIMRLIAKSCRGYEVTH